MAINIVIINKYVRKYNSIINKFIDSKQPRKLC